MISIVFRGLKLSANAYWRNIFIFQETKTFQKTASRSLFQRVRVKQRKNKFQKPYNYIEGVLLCLTNLN